MKSRFSDPLSRNVSFLESFVRKFRQQLGWDLVSLMEGGVKEEELL